MEKKNKKGIVKKLLSTVLALALILTLLPNSTTVQAANADVNWDSGNDLEFKKDSTISSESGTTSYKYKDIELTTNGNAVFSTLISKAGNYRMNIKLPDANEDTVTFKTTNGKRLSKIVVTVAAYTANGAELSDGWKFNWSDMELTWTGSSEEATLSYDWNDNSPAVELQYISSIAFYYDNRTVPVSPNFTYNEGEGSFSTNGIDVGELTTMYYVGEEWTSDKPTEPGTYKVGVSVSGNETYMDCLVSDSSWTYTVTYKEYKESIEADTWAIKAAIKSSSDEINKAVLSEEELAQVASGTKAQIDAVASTASVDDGSEEYVYYYVTKKNDLKEYELFNNGGLEIGLWKMFTTDGSDAAKVTEINGKVKIGLTLPSYDDFDASKHSYKLICGMYCNEEDGKVIDLELDENNELTFEVDKLWDYYAVLYKEKANTASDNTTNTTDKTTNTTDTTDTTGTTTDTTGTTTSTTDTTGTTTSTKTTIATDTKFSTSDYVGKAMEVTTKNGGWYFSNVTTAVDFDPSFETGKELADVSKKLATVTLPSTLKYTTLDFAYSGDLPGTANVTVNLASAGFTEGSTVYLYYYNPDTNSFELICDSTYQNGSATFTMTHCSEYIVTSEKLPSALTVAAPKTGDSTDSLPFVLVLICGCAVIGTALIRKKVVR